jgi:EmrB/QacA subfamily drug resistance transporter
MERKWWTLIVVCVAVFMLLLDITVVNVALPSIERDLDASFTDLQWVVDAYALTLAALVLTAGSLADRLGRRRLFAAGLVIFSLASLLCGLAPNPNFLNAMRALQGVGGAAMFAVSLALVAQEFPPGRERGTALGLYGATIGMAVAIGPLVGGALTDGLGWEWIFFLNVPIGVAALVATFTRLHESRDPAARQPDWPGLVTFSASLFAFVFALVRGNEEGWGSPLIVGLLVAAAVLLLAFCVVERRVSDPMLPLGLFKRPAFTGVQIAAFAVAGSMFSLFLYLTLYLQNYLGLTPLESGVRFLPSTVGSFLFAMLAGQLVSRLPARLLLAVGLTGVGGGLLLMSGIHAGDDWTTLLPGLTLGGASIGLLNPVISSVAVGVVPREQSGMASGINQTFRQLGIAVGIAAWGALFLGRAADKFSQLAAGTPAATGDRPRQIVEAASSGALQPVLRAVPPNARETVTRAAHEGFLAGLNEILVAAALLAFVGAILSLLLVRPEDVGEPAPSGERAPEPAPA